MTASHVVAGVVTVAIVRHGEQLRWSSMGTIEAAVTTIVRLIRLCQVPEERRRGFLEHASYGLGELLQRDIRLQLRGPPAQQFSCSQVHLRPAVRRRLQPPPCVPSHDPSADIFFGTPPAGPPFQ
ncbi:hypothetical protein IWX65_002962 [Arthrobacter sp. CAN_A214]|uniref:hypothetical protein n=1 Tax=Arthrobacter sp. CAN_A214 TaxID=2787720 RepID=UPI0018C9B38A